MPKTTKGGAAKQGELPSKTHDSAADQYGSEERARQQLRKCLNDVDFPANNQERDGDGAANGALAAGDDRLFARELSRTPVALFAAVRNGLHLCLSARNGLLLSRKSSLPLPLS